MTLVMVVAYSSINLWFYAGLLYYRLDQVSLRLHTLVEVFFIWEGKFFVMPCPYFLDFVILHMKLDPIFLGAFLPTTSCMLVSAEQRTTDILHQNY